MKNYGPPPYYLTAILSESLDQFEGTVVFPSSDPSLEARGRANVTHQMFGIWNAAHSMLEPLRISHPLVRTQNSEHFHCMVLETPYHLSITGEMEDDTHGSIEAVYTAPEGTVYARFTIHFTCVVK